MNKQLKLTLIAALLMSGGAQASVLLNNLGGTRGFGDLIMSPNDDGSSVQQSLAFNLNFFSQNYSSFWVNNNGNISFNGPLRTFTPQVFPISSTPMIAPFWADVDTRNRVDNLPTPNHNNVYLARPDSNTVVVTWDTVGYYSSSNDKQNSFQLVLKNQSNNTNNAGDFDMEFRYNQLQWTTGSASGGVNGLGGNSAVAGWNAGNASSSFALAGSGSPNILRLTQESNTDTAGLWRFQVRNDSVAGSQPFNPLIPVNAGTGAADGGWFFENIPVVPETRTWFDPEVATGYKYEVLDGPLISSVILPQAIGDSFYDISTWNGNTWELIASNVQGGQNYTFASAVQRFMVTGIEVGANINPNSPIAFSTGLTFAAAGNVNLVQSAILAPVPEPETYALMGLGLVGLIAARRRKLAAK